MIIDLDILAEARKHKRRDKFHLNDSRINLAGSIIRGEICAGRHNIISFITAAQSGRAIMAGSINSGADDKWVFRGEWRWRRTAPNGNIVGASTQGYVNRSDAVVNAQRNRYRGT